MYSAVLMLALTAGTDAVDHGRNNCYGCSVCSCSTVYSCACSSSGHHGLFNRGHGCNSCSVVYTCSSCSVCSSYGCCCNSGHRGGLFGRHHNRCNSCSSCYGGCTVYSSGCVCSGGVIVPGAPLLPPPTKEMPKKAATEAPATIVVSLPAEARLIVDGASTNSTSERRTLLTPSLEFGSTYIYTMQAELVRDGQTLRQTQEVTVRGGEVSNVTFNFTTQAVASR